MTDTFVTTPTVSLLSRDKNLGHDERKLHTPKRVIEYRDAIEKGFPGAKITWAFSWLALYDTTVNYTKIRELVVGFHYKYGDEVTFIPGAYFANAYNTIDQVNCDLHDGLKRVTENSSSRANPANDFPI